MGGLWQTRWAPRRPPLLLTCRSQPQYEEVVLHAGLHWISQCTCDVSSPLVTAAVSSSLTAGRANEVYKPQSSGLLWKSLSGRCCGISETRQNACRRSCMRLLLPPDTNALGPHNCLPVCVCYKSLPFGSTRLPQARQCFRPPCRTLRRAAATRQGGLLDNCLCNCASHFSLCFPSRSCAPGACCPLCGDPSCLSS